MKVIHVKKQMSDEAAAALAGRKLVDSAVDLVLSEDTDVLLDDGTHLLRFRKKVLSAASCATAYGSLKQAASTSFNRGYAAGFIDDPGRVQREIGQTNGLHYRPILKDGRLSNTNYAKKALSGIIGFFDRNPRFPYCRQTAFNIQHGSEFALALPFIKEVSDVFQNVHPERWAAQMQMCLKTSRDFVIPETCFTTVTVNRNFQTAVHKDAGDYEQGYGAMTALRAGKFKGGFTCFPQYRVGVDMDNGDVLLANVHEWHGNTKMVSLGGAFVRLSCVFYYREGMQYCGTAEEELGRARSGNRRKR